MASERVRTRRSAQVPPSGICPPRPHQDSSVHRGHPNPRKPRSLSVPIAPLARALLAVAILAGAFGISFRIPEVEREIFLASSLLLVLTPTLHPWYLLWVLPFAALRMSVSWILFSGLAPLSYLSLRTADGRVPSWALGIEWSLPFVTALVIRAWKPRSATPYLP